MGCSLLLLAAACCCLLLLAAACCRLLPLAAACCGLLLLAAACCCLLLLAAACCCLLLLAAACCCLLLLAARRKSAEGKAPQNSTVKPTFVSSFQPSVGVGHYVPCDPHVTSLSPPPCNCDRAAAAAATCGRAWRICVPQSVADNT